MSNDKGCDPEYMLDKSVETVRVYFRLYVVETLEKRSLLPVRLNPHLMFNRGPISTLEMKFPAGSCGVSKRNCAVA